jgi:hypothetical protein
MHVVKQQDANILWKSLNVVPFGLIQTEYIIRIITIFKYTALHSVLQTVLFLLIKNNFGLNKFNQKTEKT